MELVQHYPALNRSLHPICSVCIANYNGTALLADCINSALAQDNQAQIEIIVHDDASSDDSVAFLRANYPQVELLASQQNVGYCISNNRMVQHAKGKYVLLLNNDAILNSAAISSLLLLIQEQNPSGIGTLPQYDYETGALVDRGCMLDPFYNPVPNLLATRNDIAMTIGACLFLSRDLWLELNGFPEWFESIGEDLYLCCLARLHNVPISVANASGYRHRQGASFGGNRTTALGKLSTTYRRRRLSERNKTFTLFICTPTFVVWPLLGIHLAMLVLEGAAMTILKHKLRIWSDIYWPTITSVWVNRKLLRAERQRIQARRRTTAKSYFSAFVLTLHKLRLLGRHGVPDVS